MVSLLKRYWRAIGVGLLFGLALLPLAQLAGPGPLGRWMALSEVAINLIFLASQLFWIRRLGAWGRRLVTGRTWRVGLGTIGLVLYLALLAYNLENWENVSKGSTLSLRAALLEAPMRVWLFGSLLGFLLITVLWCLARVLRTIEWGVGKFGSVNAPEPRSPGRRRFLGQTAIGVAAAPFFAGTYGLFYGRLNLQTTHQRIRLRRLPTV